MPLRSVVPITSPTMQGAIEEVGKLRKEFVALKEYCVRLNRNSNGLYVADTEFFYEWCADCIPPREIDVERFAKEAKGLNGIFRLRHSKEAGPNKEKFGFKGDEFQRKKLFLDAIKHRVSFIDVEANSWPFFEDLGGLGKLEYTKLIGSYHNFENMPTIEFFRYLRPYMINRMNADVGKFAVSAQSKQDLITLEDFRNTTNTSLVAICMKEIGRDTRLDWNNFFSYNPLTLDSASANGQFTAREVIDKIRLRKSK